MEYLGSQYHSYFHKVEEIFQKNFKLTSDPTAIKLRQLHENQTKVSQFPKCAPPQSASVLAFGQFYLFFLVLFCVFSLTSSFFDYSSGIKKINEYIATSVLFSLTSNS